MQVGPKYKFNLFQSSQLELLCDTNLTFKSFFFVVEQTYLQSKTARLEELRLKGQEIELWMAFHSLPRRLKKRIWQYQKYKWQETRGVDVESFLHNLPRDIRRETKRHLCSGPLSKVSSIENCPYI